MPSLTVVYTDKDFGTKNAYSRTFSSTLLIILRLTAKYLMLRIETKYNCKYASEQDDNLPTTMFFWVFAFST